MIEWGGDFHRYSGESAATVRHVLKSRIEPAIIGKDPFNIYEIRAAMNSVVRGHQYAKAAVDMGLYDLIGKALDVPVYKLLGGKSREDVKVAQSLGLRDIDAAVDEAKAVVSEGIRTIKAKGGLEADLDVRLMRRLREELGGDVNLAIDANQSYVTVGEALYVSRELADLNIRYLEQPVPGLKRLAEVRRRAEIPIMADESVWTAEDALEAVERDAADYISIYITKAGGITGAMEIAAIARAAGIPCNFNGSAETGVGNAASLHVGLASPAIAEPSVIPVTTIKGMEQTEAAGRFYLDDIITKPFPYRDGALTVHEKPGLGIELDEEKLEKYRVVD